MSEFMHTLVHSMTMKEKVYFKRFINIHSDQTDKNYLKIYDVLENMKEYNKKELFEKFKGTTINKYMSSELNYLKNKILRSLQSFHIENNSIKKLEKEISFIEILLSKGFKKEAIKKLKQVKKSAYLFEAFTTILKLIELEEDILFVSGILGHKENLKKLKEERNRISLIIQNLNELRLLREEIRSIQFSEFYINDTSKFPRLFENSLLKNDYLVLSDRGMEHWFYIQVMLNYVTRNYKKSFKYAKAHLKFVEDRKNLFFKSESIPAISNLLYLSALIKDEQTFYENIDKLENHALENPVKSYIKYASYSRRLELVYTIRDYQKMKILSEECMIWIKSISLAIEQKAYILLLIVRSKIVLKEFEQGADLINYWYQNKIPKFATLNARIFSLIIHFELGWNQLLESEVELLPKLKKSFPRDEDFINAFYKFFKNYLSNPINLRDYQKGLSEKLYLQELIKKRIFLLKN